MKGEMKRLLLLIFSPFLFIMLFSLAVHAEEWNVLVVDAAAEPGQSFKSLSDNVQEVIGNKVNYTQTVSTALKDENLADYDVVWLGWNCSSDDGGYFRDKDADLIAAYVEAGGCLVTVATDDSGWRSDWLPAAFTVLNTGDYGLEVTEEGEKLFNEPNEVNTDALIMDERYASIDKEYTVLAWGQGMEDSEAGALQITLGKGLYLMVSLDNRNAGNTQSNLALMENMLNYAIAFTKEAKAVELQGKFTKTWGEIKNEY